MVSLQCQVHLLSLKPDSLTQVRDTDFSAFKYSDKTEAKSQADRPYGVDKASFTQGRGQKWFLENKRPERLRSTLKELEDHLAEQSVVFSTWRGSRLFQIVLQSGLIVNISLNKLGDLSKINYDKYLVGKIGENITDFILTTSCVVVTYLEAKVTVIKFGKSVNFSSSTSLVSHDPKIHNLDLHCPPGRRIARRIAISLDSSQVQRNTINVDLY